MPPLHFELMEKAKKRALRASSAPTDGPSAMRDAGGLFNFFLPEVCGLSCIEYAPLQEILGVKAEP
jgi:hypothetical protein